MLAEEEITRLAHDIMKAKKVIALSGAGMSVESNIASFRGKGGLWEKYDPEEYAHISTLRHRPEKAWILLSAMQKEIAKARPNAGHRALAELEQMGMLQTIITQNVDGLHHLAGNTDIIEFHGNLQTVTCMDCGNHLPNSEISLDDIPPRCTKCKGVFKPDCVFFGEAIPADALTRAHQESRTCDLMLVLGTSAVVYPAASMPEIAKSAGAQVVEINPSETPLTRFVSDYILR
ncbi:MAG: NAD-dependent deacylase [Proteobacteria bacterium]|nr:NAD-dependent deacylase [Pseudomonadota bacterium]